MQPASALGSRHPSPRAPEAVGRVLDIFRDGRGRGGRLWMEVVEMLDLGLDILLARSPKYGGGWNQGRVIMVINWGYHWGWHQGQILHIFRRKTQ